ncbi:unnamed protein product [Musa hybrid cultivar]
MAPFGETEVELRGDLAEEPSRLDSPIGTGGADRVPEERGSVSPAEAVNFSPGGGKANGDLVGGEFSVDSPLNPSGSPSSVAASAKGYGLKKWRRIRRDTSKDVTGNADRSSKSSTAASAPSLQHEVIGFLRDRSRARNIGGKGPGHDVQKRGQWAKRGKTDAGKKIREDQVKNETENFYSSIESDLMSSNTAFLHMDSMASNGKQSEKSVNYDGGDAQPSEEVRSCFYEDNGGVGALLREDLETNQSGEKNYNKFENIHPGSDLDPFLESIVSLQATKEALENEIRNFGEIGKVVIFDDANCQYEETEGISSPAVEANFVDLNQKIEQLECKLGEALTSVKTKESKVLELKAILSRTGWPNKDIDSTNISSLQEKCKEMEIELENLLVKKIEVEIEYLVLTITTQSWKVVAEDHIASLEQQRTLSGDKPKATHKVKYAENETVIFRGVTEELEKDLSETKEVLRLQGRVFKYSVCCFVQMVILCIAFELFLLHLLPSSSGVTPT